MNEHPIDELCRLFFVDERGALLRKVRRGNQHVGVEASKMDRHGYKVVSINKRCFYVHRVVYAIHHLRWASSVIDHINGDRLDNRPENLREATVMINNQNRHKPSKMNVSGLLGVKTEKSSGRFKSYIRRDGRTKFLGSFATATEAHEAYIKARDQANALDQSKN